MQRIFSSVISRRRVLTAMAAAPLANVGAQEAWPQKPIRLIVPFAAGLSIDAVARMIADRLSRNLGQSVVIDNRPGAAGIIGTAEVAKSAPDGYTLSFNTASVITINPHVYPNQPYDVFKDLVPVVHTSNLAFVLITSPSQPYTTFQTLLAADKAEPGKINYASLGPGSSPHVLMEMLNNTAGSQFFHVPYKSSFLPDIMGKQVQIAWEPTTTSVPLIKEGKLRALAVGSKGRNSALPDVPAVAEFYPGFEGDTWHGIFAPAGTPAAVLARIEEETIKVVRLPEIQSRLADLGLQAVGSPRAAFQKLIKADYAKWGDVVKRNNIRVS